MMSLDFKQFALAREFRGLSQKDITDNIDGLSQSNLSKFEKGLLPLPETILRQLINHLKFPDSFFSKRIYNTIQNAHYRKKSSVSKALEKNIDIHLKLIGLCVDEMATMVDFPEFKLRGFDLLDGYSVESAARNTRKVLGIPPDIPVKDIFTILESAGIIVIEFNPSNDFDGVSFFSDAGQPIIVINSCFSNDRKRFTLAHELGHLVLHLSDNIFVSDDRDKEKEAHIFASEFLMPSEFIKTHLWNLKFSSLLSLKKYWLTSMSSIFRRAYYLNQIDQKRYNTFNIEFSRLGYRKSEPGIVSIDEPRAFKHAYSIIKEHFNYTDENLSESFGIPIEVLTKWFNQKSPINKLRVVI